MPRHPRGLAILFVCGMVPSVWPASPPLKAPVALKEWLPQKALVRFDPKNGHRGSMQTVAYSPNGKLVASGGTDGMVRIWDPGTGKELRRLESTGFLTMVSWSPDGKWLASANSSGFPTQIWDMATGKAKTLPGGAPKAISQYVYWSPNGKLLACPGDRGSIRLWDVAAGKDFRCLPGQDRVWAVCWSPDGNTLASATADHGIQLWDVASGKEIRQLRGHDGQVLAVDWSPDGKTLASGGTDATVRQWETATGKLIGSSTGHKNSAVEVCWSPDGRWLASASSDNTIRLWEAFSGKEVQLLAGHKNAVLSLAFSPEGNRLVSASADGTALIWSTGFLPGEAPLRLKLADLQSCWEDLAGADAGKAYRAATTLIRGSGQSVPFLIDRLKPARPADPKRVSQWIAELDSNQFPVRRKATDELEALHDLARPALQSRLAAKPSLEVRHRIEWLLGQIDRPTAESMRALRALTVLERIDSPAAKAQLRNLTTGTPEARLTREARASLSRLARRPRAGR